MNPIIEIRKKIGMPRKVFAENIGVSYGAIANYELGTRLPQLAVCLRIIELARKYRIKISLEDILCSK